LRGETKSKNEEDNQYSKVKNTRGNRQIFHKMLELKNEILELESKLTYEGGHEPARGTEADDEAEAPIPSKKFINAADRAVPTSLEGLAVINNKFIELIYPDGGDDDEAEIPIVTLQPEFLANSNVKLVCGGGSGHEPAHAGYVCP